MTNKEAFEKLQEKNIINRVKSYVLDIDCTGRKCSECPYQYKRCIALIGDDKIANWLESQNEKPLF